MVLKLFTTFIVVAAILGSPKHRAFTWSYCSSIYRVHWALYAYIELLSTYLIIFVFNLHVISSNRAFIYNTNVVFFYTAAAATVVTHLC